MTAVAILSLAVNALLAFTVCWLVTHRRRPRPVKPHPVDVRQPRVFRDPVVTEVRPRVTAIEDHARRTARRGDV